jgi:hypothetical protein
MLLRSLRKFTSCCTDPLTAAYLAKRTKSTTKRRESQEVDNLDPEPKYTFSYVTRK